MLVILEVKTNSDSSRPTYISVDSNDMDYLIAQTKQMLSCIIPVTPTSFNQPPAIIACIFMHNITFEWLDEYKNPVSDDEHMSCWEQTTCHASADNVLVLFSHKQNGDEMFIEYIPEVTQ
ncbi:hypothetical protein HNW13_017590 [Shewanella sp. BF02_Schw]|uniref:hypothetical protein n=1 Tax=Shewanella sp. BF02_Schw TaxID=394908 RepID=UPI00177CAFDE|nr:hypothetical protein [Shewanella sp. BF02_Schw]MBO1897553.1 hypothetical protein [Shewanella sp. BF02_Schw]